ncbi:solute carrier family 23 member 1 [Aplysia californica]|uniref:Solute carrier family 23 member 1 n=1 Tax=Aplysia californica TaxID=6500 RepID=A0ABM0JGQ9_APLCA|nr:solute carrier family 23 member 1 [Aplysia californica]
MTSVPGSDSNGKVAPMCCCMPITPGQVELEVDSYSDKKVEQSYEEKTSGMQYGISDIPPPHLCLLFALQHILQSISSTITVPLVTCVYFCAGDLDLVKSEVTSTFLFMCGVSTILQCLFGVRLSILQGGCHKFLPAIGALMSVDIWKCPDMAPYLAANSTLDAGDVWKPRMREIQGGIMLASVVQVLLGCTGLIGLLLRYIGPITIVPTISLVGLSLVGVALRFCQAHWGISTMTIALLLLFSQYLPNLNVPVPSWRKDKGCHVAKLPIFKLMPVILAVIVSWGLCAILTVCDVAPAAIRTDQKRQAVETASWFFWPYPGQWGMPTVSVAGFVAMLAVTLASMIESVGDYYACARISEVPPPPAHAVNRGVTMEGFSSLLSGLIGSGGATTSYSQNVGTIGLTRVASRSVMITAGFIFLIGGVIGKFGAFLVSMPDPVLGGVVLVSFGLVTSVGLSTLSFVDLSSSRNLTIIGTSLLMGLMVPRFLEGNPNAIKTGNEDVDRVITVLLGTSMFVGGVIAFVLDNTVPGTMTERGLLKWRQVSGTLSGADVDKSRRHSDVTGDKDSPPPSDKHDHNDHNNDNDNDNDDDKQQALADENLHYAGGIYNLPFITPLIRRVHCFRFWPISPTFLYGNVSCGGCCGGRRKEKSRVV